MSEEPTNPFQAKAKVPTLDQVSSGGVAFRHSSSGVEIALISVGPKERWQLPKGLVESGETPEQTAVREVREETGIETEVLDQLDTVEYWYIGNMGRRRVRFHKFVHFFLLRYTAGEIGQQNWEVNEARWVEIGFAMENLSFKGERQAVEKAAQRISSLANI